MMKTSTLTRGTLFSSVAVVDEKKDEASKRDRQIISALRKTVRRIQDKNNACCDQIAKIDVDLRDDALSPEQRKQLLDKRDRLINEVDDLQADAQIDTLSAEIIKREKDVYGESSLERFSPSQW